jgi:predicted nucleic acid-binding protein
VIHTEAANLVNGLRSRAVVLRDLPAVDLSSDPSDNPILAVAIAGKAIYLVTGDKRDLLALDTMEGVRIVTARVFADTLGLSSAD